MTRIQVILIAGMGILTIIVYVFILFAAYLLGASGVQFAERIVVVTATFPPATPSALATPTPALAETLKIGKPSYAELCDQKTTTNLTRAQADAYIEKLEGTRVVGWKRYIWQVDSICLFGICAYDIMATDKQDLSSWNVQITSKDEGALKLTKGQLWEFSGTIRGGSVYASGGCSFRFDSD